MAYATLAQLKEHVGNATTTGLYTKLTAREDGVTADDDVGQRALDAAEGEINGYLAVKYAVPISSTTAQVTSLLRSIALDLAEYALWANRNVGREIPERVQNARDDRIDFLQRIVAGKAVLPSVEVLDATANRTSATSGGWKQQYTESVMGDW